MKYGKFVGKTFKAFDNTELEKFKSIINDVFCSVGKVSLWHVDKNSTCSAFYKIKLDNPIKKTGGKSYAYNVNNLTIMITKEEGRLEEGMFNYVGEPFIQYSIKCYTDGKYHIYKKRHENDWVFEGKNHYNYDTEIPDFIPDLTNWKWNVLNGIDS